MDLGEAHWKPSGKDALFQMPLRISVTHGKRSKHPHRQESGRSRFHPRGCPRGVKASVEEVTADVVGTARELELEVEPEERTDSLQSHDKTLVDEELLLVDEQRKKFLELEPTPGEDAVKTVEMATKNLEYDISFIDKATAGFERTDPTFEKRSLVGKILSKSTSCYRESAHEKRSQAMPPRSRLS